MGVSAHSRSTTRRISSSSGSAKGSSLQARGIRYCRAYSGIGESVGGELIFGVLSGATLRRRDKVVSVPGVPELIELLQLPAALQLTSHDPTRRSGNCRITGRSLVEVGS